MALDALSKLVTEHQDLEFIKDGSKVQCKSTGHEMKAEFDVVSSYVNGGKYKKASWYKQDFSKYEPWLTQHKKKPSFLFCTLTNKMVPKDPAKIEGHMKNKDFVKRKAMLTDVKTPAAPEGKGAAEEMDQVTGDAVDDFFAKLDELGEERVSEPKKAKAVVVLHGHEDGGSSAEAEEAEPKKKARKADKNGKRKSDAPSSSSVPPKKKGKKAKSA
eukprot:CAMPEP_0204275458 /NCGR_PEP_ID=MMETSP0468-20130131/26047_1 /ASSEMBLY_ACC=CAM_ASM_000383 /TAXON_ID=2969 /ORGANISM="Oxyrrhis marina" /LENGTH=214 /DNA_ID=CAMNT_0051251801 /DNA_START=51 /DNA_END=695 /DNA_ORIENTATION=+